MTLSKTQRKKDCGNLQCKNLQGFRTKSFKHGCPLRVLRNFFSSKTIAKVVAGRFAVTNKTDTGEILEALELASKLGKNYFEIVRS